MPRSDQADRGALRFAVSPKGVVTQPHGDRAGCPPLPALKSCRSHWEPSTRVQLHIWWCPCWPQEGQRGIWRVRSGLLMMQNCRKLHQFFSGLDEQQRIPLTKLLEKTSWVLQFHIIYSSWTSLGFCLCLLCRSPSLGFNLCKSFFLTFKHIFNQVLWIAYQRKWLTFRSMQQITSSIYYIWEKSCFYQLW